MPFFKVIHQKVDIAICQDATAEDLREGIAVVLGPGDYEVEEVSEEEAEKLANKWIDDPHPDDICPICEGPRVRCPRGEIVISRCLNCNFES